ncbi:hypothetical protein FHT21_002233 [Pedobacter sp. SG908]|nr:hypothetical protein [Pedobacter sp. SG908]
MNLYIAAITKVYNKNDNQAKVYLQLIKKNI